MLHATGAAFICDQCVELAAEIIAATRDRSKKGEVTAIPATANFPHGSLGEELVE